MLGEQLAQLGGKPVRCDHQPLAHQAVRERAGGHSLDDDLAVLQVRLRSDRLGGPDLQTGDRPRSP